MSTDWLNNLADHYANQMTLADRIPFFLSSFFSALMETEKYSNRYLTWTNCEYQFVCFEIPWGHWRCDMLIVCIQKWRLNWTKYLFCSEQLAISSSSIVQRDTCSSLYHECLIDSIPRHSVFTLSCERNLYQWWQSRSISAS